MTDQDLHEKIVEKLTKQNVEEFSELFESAVDRWLDKQFARFGRWALMGMAAALFVWGVKLWAQHGGFPK